MDLLPAGLLRCCCHLENDVPLYQLDQKPNLTITKTQKSSESTKKNLLYWFLAGNGGMTYNKN